MKQVLIALAFMALTPLYSYADTSEIVLVCKTYSGRLPKPPPAGEMVNEIITISRSNQSVVSQIYKKTVKLRVEDDKYMWSLPLKDIARNPQTDDLTLESTLSRYTGDYVTIMHGSRGGVVFSRGVCKKQERAF